MFPVVAHWYRLWIWLWTGIWNSGPWGNGQQTGSSCRIIYYSLTLRKDLEIYTQKCLTNKMLLYSCFQKKVRVNTCYDFVCAQFSHQIYTTPFFSPNTLMFSLQIGRFCDPSHQHQGHWPGPVQSWGEYLEQHSTQVHSQSSHMCTNMYWSKNTCCKPKTSTKMVVVVIERCAPVCKCHIGPAYHVSCVTT